MDSKKVETGCFATVFALINVPSFLIDYMYTYMYENLVRCIAYVCSEVIDEPVYPPFLTKALESMEVYKDLASSPTR